MIFRLNVMHKKEQKLPDIYNEAKNLMILCKSKGYITNFNELNEAFYGYTSGEILTNLGVAISNILKSSNLYENEIVKKAYELQSAIHKYL